MRHRPRLVVDGLVAGGKHEAIFESQPTMGSGRGASHALAFPLPKVGKPRSCEGNLQAGQPRGVPAGERQGHGQRRAHSVRPTSLKHADGRRQPYLKLIFVWHFSVAQSLPSQTHL